MGADALKLPVLGDHDLARLDIPQKLRADAVEGAALRGEGIAVLRFADAQRPEAVGVAGGDQLFGGHDDERIGPLERVHRLGDRLLDARGEQPLAGDDIADDLAVVGRVEDRAVHFELAAQVGGVDEVAVVGERHRALAVAHDERLGVDDAAVARRRIAAVAHRHIALPEAFEHVPVEDVGTRPTFLWQLMTPSSFTAIPQLSWPRCWSA